MEVMGVTTGEVVEAMDIEDITVLMGGMGPVFGLAVVALLCWFGACG